MIYGHLFKGDFASFYLGKLSYVGKFANPLLYVKSSCGVGDRLIFVRFVVVVCSSGAELDVDHM